MGRLKVKLVTSATSINQRDKREWHDTDLQTRLEPPAFIDKRAELIGIGQREISELLLWDLHRSLLALCTLLLFVRVELTMHHHVITT
jgi:hypothetical protein